VRGETFYKHQKEKGHCGGGRENWDYFTFDGRRRWKGSRITSNVQENGKEIHSLLRRRKEERRRISQKGVRREREESMGEILLQSSPLERSSSNWDGAEVHRKKVKMPGEFVG